MINVSSITLNKTNITLQEGHTYALDATVSPENATNKNLNWTTTDSSIATVKNGVITAKKAGTVYINAQATDGSFESAPCALRITNDVLVTKIVLDKTVLNLSVGDTKILFETVYPQNATNSSLQWSSSNEQVALVNPENGFVIAQRAGTAVITARATDGSGVSAKCEVWVKGKTPVILIHGRASNSFDAWGAGNRIFVNPMHTEERDNNHFNSSVNALSQGNGQYLYTNKSVQDIFGYQTGQTIKVDGTNVTNFTMPGVFNGKFEDGEYTSKHPQGGNLAYYLKSNGYKENVNLFVFNYPNQDAVIHSAKKFEKYIENLISYVRSNGTDEMKACFYTSKNNYDSEHHKINLIGHSMGGLVARYYIENLCQDEHVDKLITICTPHWGSSLAEISNNSSILHMLCDHDLDPNSEMYGGNNKNVLESGCSLLEFTDVWTNCTDSKYETTPKLKYLTERETEYYAIAGVNYTTDNLPEKDYELCMPTNFTTYEQISGFMLQNNVYKSTGKDPKDVIDFKNASDNVVSFLSQIGWTNNDGNSPQKRIQMKRILIIVDNDGGNSIPSHLHGKMAHRNCVFKNIKQFLSE